MALTLVGLGPFALLSTATFLVSDELAGELGGGRTGVQLALALANGAHAFTVVVAAELARRVSARVLCVAGMAAAGLGGLLSALAPVITVFAAGRVLHGAAAGLLLVVALPRLVTGQPPQRLPTTAVFLSIGLFGAATGGPSLGVLAGAWHAWRMLFGAVALLGVLGVWAALRAVPAEPLPTASRPRWSALGLAAVATVPPFVGLGLLGTRPASSPAFLIPTAVGLAALVTLVWREYRAARPLLTVRAIAHTLPLLGLAGAMLAGAGYTLLVDVAMA